MMPSVTFKAFSNGKWICLAKSAGSPKNINFYPKFIVFTRKSNQFFQQISFTRPPLKTNFPYKERICYNYRKKTIF